MFSIEYATPASMRILINFTRSDLCAGRCHTRKHNDKSLWYARCRTTPGDAKKKTTFQTCVVYIRKITGCEKNTMQASWKMCNALRLTRSFEEISYNQAHYYNAGDIVYFTGKSETTENGDEFVRVCYWEKHRNDPFDIPADFWVLKKWLQRAYDERDREVRNPNFVLNLNANTGHLLCRK